MPVAASDGLFVIYDWEYIMLAMSDIKKREREMQKIGEELAIFRKSPLYKYRQENGYLPVVGEGNLSADIMFVGEAPGKNEAIAGKPFCGRSGKLLDDLLDSAGIKRADVYITNIVKDRPPENRDPTPEEKELYAPFLDRQIEIVKPRVIAALGRHSMEYLMRRFGLEKELQPISIAHGRAFETETAYGKIFVVALYHPAVAIYNRKQKETLVKDIKIIKKLIV